MRTFVTLAVLAMFVAPASANFLVNGDLEDPGPTTSPWVNAGAAALILNNTNHAPPGPQNWLSSQGGEGGDRGWKQTVDVICTAPGPDCVITAAGDFVAGDNNGDWISCRLSISVVGHGSSYVDIPVNGGGDWQSVETSVTIPGGCPGTYEVTYMALLDDGGGWSGGTTLHGDNMTLVTECIPEPTSLALLGRAGLPLLRRRR